MPRRDWSQCQSVFYAKIRTATGSRPYLANNDYPMQVVGHNLHHIQFNVWVMIRDFMPCFVNHPAGIV